MRKRTPLSKRKLPVYSRGEEIMNMVTHIVGGGIDTYVNWLNGKINCTLNELCDYLSSLIKHGLKGVINYGD